MYFCCYASIAGLYWLLCQIFAEYEWNDVRLRMDRGKQKKVSKRDAVLHARARATA
jgi:hypothetical protein